MSPVRGNQSSERILLECVELCGEITLTGVGQDSHDALAGVLLLACQAESGPGCCAGRYAYQQAFLKRELTACAQSVVVGHRDDAVDEAADIVAWHKVGADALYLVRTGLTLGEER